MQPFSASSPGEVLALTRPAQPTQPDHNGDTQGSAATSQALAPASSSIVIGDNNALNGANCAFQNTVAGDLNLYQVTNIAYPAPDHSARINQLPPQQEDFVGRTRVRQRLVEALANQRPTVGIMCNLYGMGGIGKTALAVWVAHAVADLYDGVLFIEIQHSSTGQAGGLAKALQQAVRPFLGYHATLPTDTEELSAVYRQMLHGRRFLVVLDDVDEAATLRPFTPPAGCALLTTSRARLLLDTPANTCVITGLQLQDAQALLLSRAPHVANDPFLATLLERCDYLPLALRLVSTILAERPSLTVERYLSDLESALHRPTALHYADQDVYDIVGRTDSQLAGINPSLDTRWRMLSVCPDSFPANVAAAIWEETDANVVEAQLTELCRYSLLRYEAGTQRYTLPRLLRDVAQQRCDPAARARAAERYAAFFQRLNTYAHGLIETPNDAAYGLSLLQEVWPHLLGAGDYLQQQTGMLSERTDSDLVGPEVIRAIRLHFNTRN